MKAGYDAKIRAAEELQNLALLVVPLQKYERLPCFIAMLIVNRMEKFERFRLKRFINR